MNQQNLFVKGNEALARGAMAAGMDCYFGYPITPQNDIPEFLSSEMPKAGKQFLQAESEVAAINMVLGACATGKLSMTSSSSPGVSLMQEGISYLAGAQLPGVIVNVSRGGPGIGDLGASQSDYFQATRGGGHGDYRTLVIAPSTAQESFDMAIEAFRLAFKYRNPVLLLTDAIIGHVKESIVAYTPEPIDTKAGDWCLGFDRDAKGRHLHSQCLTKNQPLAPHTILLKEKYEKMQDEVLFEEYLTDDADFVVVAYGSIARVLKNTIDNLRRDGHKIGLFRPITLYPFPSSALRKLATGNRRFMTIEQNLGQMVEDVRLALAGNAESAFYGQLPGTIANPDDFYLPVLDTYKGEQ